jgi:hypothetical protein
MRLSTASIFLVLAAAAGEACSFFIPFDEYAGTPDGGNGAGGSSGGVGEGGADADNDAADDGGDDGASACKGVDTKSDPQNCGVCGRHCANDGGCEAGRCPVEIVFGGGGAAFEAFDIGAYPADAGDAIYFTRADGTVGRLLLASGPLPPPPIENAPDAGPAAGPISVTGNGVVGAFAAGDAGIESFRGTTFTTVAPTAVSPAPGLTSMSLQGFVVFWGDSGGLWWKDTRVGGARSGPVIGTDLPVAIEGSQAPILYWTSVDGTTYRMDSRSPGVAAQVFAAGLAGGVESIAVTKKNVVLGQKSQGLVVYAFGTTDATFVRRVTIPDPQVLVTDQSHVYALDLGTPTRARLLRTLPDGTELITVADQFSGTHAIVLDGDWVYYADGAKILRTSK